MRAPLEGVRVVDSTQGLAGPYCAMLMAMHGADVIKVEPPTGDWSRSLGAATNGMTAAFIACNRNKRGIQLDLKDPDDVADLLDLTRQSDVFMESNRAGVATRLGIDFDTIQQARSDIIYLSVTGFGQSGPYRNRPATDAIMQAFSGFMTRNLDHNGLAKRIEFPVPDYTTGLMAYQAVSTALIGKFRGHDEAVHLDISLMGAMLAYQQAAIVDWELGNRPVGSPMAPTGTYRTADGMLNIAIIREKYFANLCEALGLPELLDDPRFDTLEARQQHSTEIRALIQNAIEQLPSATLESRFDTLEVPHCRVNDYTGVLTDQHVLETGAFTTMHQPGIGDWPMFDIPGAMPSTTTVRPAPSLGEHTEEVLRELGLRA
jgi:crotonobetainyl-CoA:carnitine CoA-transferase CaiB-like acyl-CoA transferase